MKSLIVPACPSCHRGDALMVVCWHCQGQGAPSQFVAHLTPATCPVPGCCVSGPHSHSSSTGGPELLVVPPAQPAPEPQQCERGCNPDHRCRRCRLEDAARAGLLPAQEVPRG